VITKDSNLTIRRGERWRHGEKRRGQDHAAQDDAGASAPDAGSVRLGASLYMGYFAQQSLDVLNPDLTVIEQLQQDSPGRARVIAELAGAFQFSGEDVDKKIRASRRRKIAAGIARMLYNRRTSCARRTDQSPDLATKRCWWTP